MDENAARIQTVSSIPCPHEGNHWNNPYTFRLGAAFTGHVVCIATKGGTWWQITELHPPIECLDGYDHTDPTWHGDKRTDIVWTDDLRGAVPHTKPEPAPAKRVTSDMKFAAWNLLIGRHPWDKFSPNDVRDAIEAALAAQDTGDTP
jgi:hypothetical protein